MSPTALVVIGAGLAGTATAWRLAERGHVVTVVERATPANEWGSSHGSARIFRYAYPDQFYTDLVVRAKEGWDELIERSGRDLIDFHGGLDHGSKRDPANLSHVLTTAGVEHELLSASAARERWPGFVFEDDVLWQPTAGVIDAEKSVEAMIALARQAGATILEDWTAARIVPRLGGYEVVSTTGETLTAAEVIICAGGWLPELIAELPFAHEFPPMEIREENAYHFPFRDEAALPTFIHKRDNMQTYGLPGGRDADFRGLKVAEYNGGSVIRSASSASTTIDPANRDRVVDYVSRYIPGVIPEPYAETTCLFTNLPNEDFIIDRIDGITVVSPCSGHGAKFAPLIGEFAAALVSDATAVPERFTLKRLAALDT